VKIYSYRFVRFNWGLPIWIDLSGIEPAYPVQMVSTPQAPILEEPHLRSETPVGGITGKIKQSGLHCTLFMF